MRFYKVIAPSVFSGRWNDRGEQHVLLEPRHPYLFRHTHTHTFPENFKRTIVKATGEHPPRPPQLHAYLVLSGGTLAPGGQHLPEETL